MLSAAARNKLQQVARWCRDELKANQNPEIRLGYSGGLVYNSERNETVLSPIGVLVQMYNPMNAVDLKKLTYATYTARNMDLHWRAAEILELQPSEFLRLVSYLHFSDLRIEHTIKQLRSLK